MKKILGLNLNIDNRTSAALVLLLIVLVICNLTFVPSTGWDRLLWNLFGYAGLLAAYKVAELKLADIGLSRSHVKSGLKYAAYTIAIITSVLILAFFIDKLSFRDPRYHHNLATAVYASVILLPLKTVLFEELAFRGIFLALLFRLKNNRWLASVVSSIAFGLWHIGSAATIGNYRFSSNLIVPRLIVIFSILIFTTLAGIFLCELRWRSKSLITPIAVHWFVNAAVIILASLSWH